MADVITPYLGLTVPEIGTASYAPKVNADLVLIDTAYGAKTPHVLATGNILNGTLNLTVPTGFNEYELRLGDIRPPSGYKIFARMNGDAGSTAYEYLRSDVTAAAGGTQAFEASTGAAALIISPAVMSSVSDGNVRQAAVIRFSTYPSSLGAYNNNKFNAVVDCRSAAGNLALAQTTGALITPGGVITSIQIGAVTGSDYTGDIALKYALLGLPGT